MVEVAVFIALIPFTILCACASILLYNRDRREQRAHLHDLSKDYSQQWEDFEAKHKERFEADYWNTTVRNIHNDAEEVA